MERVAKKNLSAPGGIVDAVERDGCAANMGLCAAGKRCNGGHVKFASDEVRSAQRLRMRD